MSQAREPTTRALWHAAGRAARDDRKRLLALQGVLWTGPVLVLGAVLARLPHPDPAALRRPLAYLWQPLQAAWWSGDDVALLGYVALQALLVALLWGLFGGALHRLAAVELTAGRRDDGPAGLAFARRHWLAFVGGRAALWAGVLVPLAAAVGVAALGRLPGWAGGVLLALAVGAAVLLAMGAVVVASVMAMGAFLSAPTVACEDSDAFDAVSRSFTYVAAGLPRVAGLRLLFGCGVLLGAGWRLLRTLVVALLALAVLRVGAGSGGLDRALAVLGAGGRPPDAARLGIAAPDYVVAAALAFAAGSLVVLWLADLASRVVCARTAVYLLLRREVDHVPVSHLRTAPRRPAHQGAAEAGFTEVARIEGS
jgi:hypothetical protein